MNVTQPGVFVSWKRAMYFRFQVHTVKLGFKKLLNKEQLVNSETFPVTNMPFHLMNSEQIVFSEQSYYNQKVLYYQVWLYNCNFLVFFYFCDSYIPKSSNKPQRLQNPKFSKSFFSVKNRSNLLAGHAELLRSEITLTKQRPLTFVILVLLGVSLGFPLFFD